MSWVTVKAPNAPDPLACIRLSGITSRWKLASFSRSHTSCKSAGPRGPAVSMLTLSLTGAPVAWVKWGRVGLSIIVGSIRLVSTRRGGAAFFGEDGGQLGQRDS